MIAAHEIATGDGLEPDSDDYFAAIETTLRLRQPVSAPQERQSAPPAAPVNRETRPGTVRLSAAEREMAQMMGMSEKEYAQNKQALIKEGRVH
jgi:phage I-like protein